jgi:murein L,D-transpeptidase YafK
MSHRILVAKTARTLDLILDGRLERRYSIALGRNAAADKSVEGDHATPLGEFYICAKNPRSKYFLSLCISYPNAEDAKRGLAENLIDADEYGQIMEALHIGTMPPQHTRLGGEIYIHGREVKDAETASSENDWTRGCIALDNSDMQDLYHRIDIGTPIRIDP